MSRFPAPPALEISLPKGRDRRQLLTPESPVERRLRKVFAKLGITSRRRLRPPGAG